MPRPSPHRSSYRSRSPRRKGGSVHRSGSTYSPPRRVPSEEDLEKPVFRGAETRAIFDREELMKVQVKVMNRPLEAMSTPVIHRAVTSPEDIIIVRRPGEGSRPMFSTDTNISQRANTADQGRVISIASECESLDKARHGHSPVTRDRRRLSRSPDSHSRQSRPYSPKRGRSRSPGRITSRDRSVERKRKRKSPVNRRSVERNGERRYRKHSSDRRDHRDEKARGKSIAKRASHERKPTHHREDRSHQRGGSDYSKRKRSYSPQKKRYTPEQSSSRGRESSFRKRRDSPVRHRFRAGHKDDTSEEECESTADEAVGEYEITPEEYFMMTEGVRFQHPAMQHPLPPGTFVTNIPPRPPMYAAIPGPMPPMPGTPMPMPMPMPIGPPGPMPPMIRFRGPPTTRMMAPPRFFNPPMY